MQVNTDFFDNGQGYHARGIVARLAPIGHFQVSVLVKEPIYKYLTLDCGDARGGCAVEFVRQARVIEENGQSYLDPTDLQPGQIVVAPGFVYKKIPWSSTLYAEHLKALKTYRRKDIIKADKDDAPAVDIGVIDPNGLTKQ